MSELYHGKLPQAAWVKWTASVLQTPVEVFLHTELSRVKIPVTPLGSQIMATLSISHSECKAALLCHSTEIKTEVRLSLLVQFYFNDLNINRLTRFYLNTSFQYSLTKLTSLNGISR